MIRQRESKSTQSCTVGDCEKPAIPRMDICWAHYRRAKRGAKIEGPVRDYGTDQELINGPHLAPKVYEMLRIAAEAHPGPSGEPSIYDAQRRVLHSWLKRQMAGDPPFLMGQKAFLEPVLSEEGYHNHGRIPVSVEQNAALEAVVSKLGLTLHGLVVKIFDDWYWYWRENDKPAAEDDLSPYPSPKAKGKTKRK